MDNGPTDDELRAFVDAMLSNLDKQLRGAEVIEETICNHRGMWIKPYQVGLGFDTRDGASP